MRYRDRKPSWEKAGFARMAYVGEGGAPATSYSMDMIHLPRGVAIKPYVREVEDVYFVLEGAITVGWEQDGEIVERRLGERDLMFNPAGRAHYFRNDGAADAQFTHGHGLAQAAARRLRSGMTVSFLEQGPGHVPWSCCTASARRRARSIG